MDEPRAHRSGAIRVQEQPADDTFGLLCSWNGHIRNDQREHAVPRGYRPNSFHEGNGRETASTRERVHGESVEGVENVLGTSTRRPPGYQ